VTRHGTSNSICTSSTTRYEKLLLDHDTFAELLGGWGIMNTAYVCTHNERIYA
jgi:hypothetical protein